MAVPGDRGGECVRCGERTILVGYDHCVYGVVCEACDLLIALPGVETSGGDGHVDPDEVSGR